MDIHRCRFVPYPARGISTVSFSHSSNPKQHTPRNLKLALGRENGDVEIWNPVDGLWTQERIFRGSDDRVIEQLHWTQELVLPDEDEPDQKIEAGSLRLYSSGGSTSLTEWDLQKGIPKHHAESNTSEIWCFAPQPQWTLRHAGKKMPEIRRAPSQLVAAGCADGSIVLFATADTELRFDRILTRAHAKKSRCLSITWRDRNTIVAGFEESVIRVFDVRNKQVIRSLTLGKGREGDKPCVWAVHCLPNGTVLSGDSTGELKIWDAQNFSLTQRLKTHTSDVMDIATNHAGSMILTCGADRRTVAYAPQTSTGSARTQRWQEIRHRRFHDMEAKAIAAFESRSLSIAISGGADAVPVVVPLQNWNEEYHRSLPHLPHKPQMAVSKAGRLLLTWWGRELFFWQVPTRYREPAQTDSVMEDQAGQKLLGSIQLKDEESITSADISSSGTMAAVATSAAVKLFQLKTVVSPSGRNEIRSRPVELLETVSSQGASTVKFAPDGKWLCAVRLNNVVSMVRFVDPGSPKERPTVFKRVVKLDRKRRKSQPMTPELGDYHRSISCVEFSSDSRILAVGDLSGDVDTWILEGHEGETVTANRSTDTGSDSAPDEDSDSDTDDETDSRVIYGQKWIRTPAGSQLPSLESPILALAFKPTSEPPVHPSRISGNEGLHATRHTHHPISPEHPPAEAGYVAAATANHQVVMFDVLSCRLADWARQNPSPSLPQSFKQIKDSVMGMWFDSRPAQNVHRLWLYGANFVYMLDLTQDLRMSQQSKPSLVRVGRLGDHVLEVHPDHALVKADDLPSKKSRKRKRGMGAGDEMSEDQKYSAQIRPRTDHGDIEMGLLSPPRSVAENEDNEVMDDADKTSEEKQDEKEQKPGRATWYSFQYRSVYGACKLSAEGQTEDQESMDPEVIIIERPTFDLELGPRFQSGQDWD